MSHEEKRTIIVKCSEEEKQQIKNLSKKYHMLYERYDRLSKIMNIMIYAGIILFMVNIWYLYAFTNTDFIHVKQILIISSIVISILLMITYAIKEQLIETKCSKYAWYGNVIYDTLIRQIERLEKASEKNNFTIKEHKLYYGNGAYDCIQLHGNIPNGNLTIAIRSYGDAHTWIAEPA